MVEYKPIDLNKAIEKSSDYIWNGNFGLYFK